MIWRRIHNVYSIALAVPCFLLMAIAQIGCKWLLQITEIAGVLFVLVLGGGKLTTYRLSIWQSRFLTYLTGGDAGHG